MTISVMRLLDDIKRSKFWEVEVDLPEHFQLRGTIPFHVWIHSDGRAKFSVLATDPDSATERVYEWLNSLDE